MKKSEKIISEFFKPYFEKYPQMDSIWFGIYDFNDNVYLYEEDYGINGLHYDDLRDKKMIDSSDKIQDAIFSLMQSKCDVANVIEDLQKLVLKLRKDAEDSNPLRKVLDDVWNDDIIEKLTKKVSKHLAKEIPWKYVKWCQCNVSRDGSVKIDEYQR